MTEVQGCLPRKGTCTIGVLGRTRNSVWVLLFQGPSRRKRLQSNHRAISGPFPPLMPPLRGKHQVKNQPLESGRAAMAEALPLSLPPRSIEISGSQATTSARRRWCCRRTLASWGMRGVVFTALPLLQAGLAQCPNSLLHAAHPHTSFVHLQTSSSERGCSSVPPAAPVHR